MSEPVKNSEIEDVLSSIRRLVSEDSRFDSRPPPAPAVEDAERLVLTPAQRIVDREAVQSSTQPLDPAAPWETPGATLYDAVSDVDVATSEQASEPDMAAQSEGTAQAPTGVFTLTQNLREDPDTEAEPESSVLDLGAHAILPEDTEETMVSEEAEDASVTEATEEDQVADPIDVQETVSDDGETSEPDKSDMVEETMAEVTEEDAISDEGVDTPEMSDGSPVEMAETEPDEVPVAEDAATEAVNDQKEPLVPVEDDGEAASDAIAPEHDEPDTVALTESETETHASDTSEDPTVPTDLGSKIKALEAAVFRANDDWEPDEETISDQSWNNVETIAWRDHLDRAAEASSLDEDADEEDQGYDDEETILDEDALRELVADIVRQELQGALGERITRNVRKLVRREIHRALTTQDL